MTKCPAALLRHSLLGNCDFPYMTKFLSPPPPCFASYEHSHALLLLLPSSARNYCIFCLQKFVNRLEKITLPFLSNVQARTGQEQIIKVTNHSRVFFFCSCHSLQPSSRHSKATEKQSLRERF